MRRILQSFGILDFPRFAVPKIDEVLDLFPDTPVYLLKDVFEALQLYDLVDLLEKPARYHTTRSLRQALTLDEIRKLRSTSNRPTTFHSCAAVLILVRNKGDPDVNKIKTFFTDLQSNSEVTIIKCTGFMSISNYEHIQRQLKEKERQIRQLERVLQEQSVTAQKGELQRRRQELEEHEREKKYLENMLKKENENELMATKVIDRWIHFQGWCELKKNIVSRFDNHLLKSSFFGF